MRRLHFAGVVAAIFSGPAFAGSVVPPTPPTPPTPLSTQPQTVSETQSVSMTGGVQVNANIHSGSLGLAESAAVQTTVVIGASQSISAKGFTVP
jgi:hypothetical protein